jgi:hypothetical protein
LLLSLSSSKTAFNTGEPSTPVYDAAFGTGVAVVIVGEVGFIVTVGDCVGTGVAVFSGSGVAVFSGSGVAVFSGSGVAVSSGSGVDVCVGTSVAAAIGVSSGSSVGTGVGYIHEETEMLSICVKRVP